MAIVTAETQGSEFRILAKQVDQRGCVLQLWQRTSYDGESVRVGHLILDVHELADLAAIAASTLQTCRELATAAIETG